MARQASKNAVDSAIEWAAKMRSQNRPILMADVVARCTVSSATFYRVLQESPESRVALQLALPQAAEDEVTDVPATPTQRTVSELVEMIATLVVENERQADLIDELRHDLRRVQQRPVRLLNDPTPDQPGP